MENEKVILIENELRKRHAFAYSWGKKQDNEWDKLTSFIYQTEHFIDLKIELSKRFYHQDNFKELCYYAMNRWYNFHSAKAVEELFCSHPFVTPHQDEFHKEIDFYINDLPFDHKTSVFPLGLNKDLKWAQENKEYLIHWLYDNQSKEQRHHCKNRIFIILYDQKGEHWKLKSELTIIKIAIDRYFENWSPEQLITIEFPNQKVVADVIWVVR